MDLLLERIPAPSTTPTMPLQALVTNLDASPYVGRLALCRVRSGTLRKGRPVAWCRADGTIERATHRRALHHRRPRPGRRPTRPGPGEIVAVAGIPEITIGETLADPDDPRPLPVIHIDDPSLSMTIGINTSPLAGQEGTSLTARLVKNRLDAELVGNVSIRVLPTERPDTWEVQGRGELQLAVLVEMMRREGFELTVGKPQVLTREIDGVVHEPVDRLTVDVPEEFMGVITQLLALRKGRMEQIVNHGTGWVRLDYLVPARGLIGFRTELMTETRGTALLHHVFERYEPWAGAIRARTAGLARRRPPRPDDRLLAAVAAGARAAVRRPRRRGLRGDDRRRERPRRRHGRQPDEGEEADQHPLSTPTAFEKLIPPRPMSLEQALEFIADDECVEVTPTVGAPAQGRPRPDRARPGRQAGQGRRAGLTLASARHGGSDRSPRVRVLVLAACSTGDDDGGPTTTSAESGPEPTTPSSVSSTTGPTTTIAAPTTSALPVATGELGALDAALSADGTLGLDAGPRPRRRRLRAGARRRRPPTRHCSTAGRRCARRWPRGDDLRADQLTALAAITAPPGVDLAQAGDGQPAAGRRRGDRRRRRSRRSRIGRAQPLPSERRGSPIVELPYDNADGTHNFSSAAEPCHRAAARRRGRAGVPHPGQRYEHARRRRPGTPTRRSSARSAQEAFHCLQYAVAPLDRRRSRCGSSRVPRRSPATTSPGANAVVHAVVAALGRRAAAPARAAHLRRPRLLRHARRGGQRLPVRRGVARRLEHGEHPPPPRADRRVRPLGHPLRDRRRRGVRPSPSPRRARPGSPRRSSR